MSAAFSIPGTVVTGVGAVERVGDEARKLDARKALVVTDPGVAELGYADDVIRRLEEADIKASLFADVTPDPTLSNVRDAHRQHIEDGCDLIVGLGGGSAIDCAKAVAAQLTNDGEITDYMGVGRVPNPAAPIIAIPTTGGTGSEVTKVAVITDTDRNVKVMVSSANLLAQVALVDPTLTLTTPPGLTAAVGVDALTHAIEAYISNRAQPITDALALKAIRLIAGSLRQAWADGSNLKAREDMSLGSCLAGMAFSNSSVALVHGMARPLGAHFHLHHGLSNAVLLLDVMRFTLPGAPERFEEIARAMGEQTDGLSLMDQADCVIRAVERLVADIQLPRLADLGIDGERFERVIDQMAQDALDSGSPANNPRQATAQDIADLYCACFEPTI